jgi:hypothetical protein
MSDFLLNAGFMHGKLPARKTPLKRTGRPRAKRPGPSRRVSVVRDRGYLNELVSLRCVVCLNPEPDQGCDPAHGPVNGAGSKGGDDGAISLCRTHHREQHAIGWPAFEEKYIIDRAGIAAELYQRYKTDKSK